MPADFLIQSALGASGVTQDGGYQLLPGDAVMVSAGTEPTVTVYLPAAASATSYAASYLGGWLVDRLARRNPYLLSQTAEECAAGVAGALQANTQPWDTTVRAAIRGAASCRSLIQAVEGSQTDDVIARSADDIVTRASRYRGLWDDVARILDQVLRLVR